MSHHFNIKDYNSFRSINKKNKTTFSQIVLPKELGLYNYETTKINEDISLIKMEQNLNEDITIDSANENIFFINIILEGEYNYKNNFHKKYDLLNNGGTITCFVNEEKGIHIRKAKNPLKTLGIAIKGQFLEDNLFSKLEDTKYIANSHINILKNKITNIQTKICANELFYMKENDILENIFKESKVLEIIYNEFNDILKNTKNISLNPVKIDEYDQEALNKAKDILTHSIKNPPSIKELSKQVRLNEFKLKKGFKEKFNITPYKFLEQCRMEKAKYLLENEDININEVSEYLGYKYQSNFSKVFKQYFKVNPKDIMKKRSYYY